MGNPLIFMEGSSGGVPSEDPGRPDLIFYEDDPTLMRIFHFPTNEKLFEIDLPPKSEVYIRRRQ